MMRIAGIRHLQHSGRMRWRRFLLPLFAIWLTGSLLLTIAFGGWEILSGSGVSRSNVAREQTVSPRFHMRF